MECLTVHTYVETFKKNVCRDDDDDGDDVVCECVCVENVCVLWMRVFGDVCRACVVCAGMRRICAPIYVCADTPVLCMSCM